MFVETDAPNSFFYFDEFAEKNSGHWSTVAACLREHFGRELTPEEVTLLSLSRDFGPTPCLDTESRQSLFNVLWPQGNPPGAYHTWEEMKELLPTDKQLGHMRDNSFNRVMAFEWAEEERASLSPQEYAATRVAVWIEEGGLFWTGKYSGYSQPPEGEVSP